ncbi:MAG: hypothetical protein ACI934_000412 [Pseudohongiellaceae bacterium]|jgi:hypothetical protein
MGRIPAMIYQADIASSHRIERKKAVNNLFVRAALGLFAALLFTSAIGQTAVPRPDSNESDSRPAPRNSEGRVILGTLPGEEMGAWDGFGSRPMIIDYDIVPEGSIVASNDYERLVNDENRPFDKINLTDVPFKPWAWGLYQQRTRTRFEPYTRCKPSAGPRGVTTAYGTQFVEFDAMQRIYMFPVGGPRHFRVIYMDGRAHPEDLEPSYHGHSIGHWEEDTLVVDSVGYNEKMWIDAEGTPHTDQLHLIERFTRETYNTLKYEVTIDDPGAYTETWSSGFVMPWRPGEAFEFVCQDANMAFEMMVGTEYDSMDRSHLIFP